jgi:hypothetical protein
MCTPVGQAPFCCPAGSQCFNGACKDTRTFAWLASCARDQLVRARGVGGGSVVGRSAAAAPPLPASNALALKPLTPAALKPQSQEPVLKLFPPPGPPAPAFLQCGSAQTAACCGTDETCWQGARCCKAASVCGGECCEKAQTCCGGAACCTRNQVCINSGCRPTGSAACGRTVCAPGEDCLGNSVCCRAGSTLCGGRCCDSATSSCLNGQCAALGSSLCNGLVCEWQGWLGRPGPAGAGLQPAALQPATRRMQCVGRACALPR